MSSNNNKSNGKENWFEAIQIASRRGKEIQEELEYELRKVKEEMIVLKKQCADTSIQHKQDIVNLNDHIKELKETISTKESEHNFELLNVTEECNSKLLRTKSLSDGREKNMQEQLHGREEAYGKALTEMKEDISHMEEAHDEELKKKDESAEAAVRSLHEKMSKMQKKHDKEIELLIISQRDLAIKMKKQADDMLTSESWF